ncbi:hypothetical protein HJC23_000817 [Cyclotella cryptica]|uniref:Cytochrome b5 heme-binding domain-containing protein n=1 Tax=Cyclotella cryptica TaxID=29204 RepID=A0ABD3Q4T1_9STRA|eukprot:CCRYP_008463-RA/>CCRYP_008463-RA protein AED:0.17 eAED:0.17 QI:0/-1/0/1/-1/1/1/0/326
MTRRSGLPRNNLLVLLCTLLYTSYHSPIGLTLRDSTSSSFAFAAAQATDPQTCKDGDQTCAADKAEKCHVETKDNCSEKELEYIQKMTIKSSEERQSQISRLNELLTRDEQNLNSALIPWIKERLHILYSLEGMPEDSNDTVVEDSTFAKSDEQPSNAETIRTNSNNERLITIDELAQHTTEENQIWLSILGKVYDVTTGISFYGPNSGSYKFYAGRDASPCFTTGKNNPEGAAEALEEWEGKKLMSVTEWSQFYEKHETYKFLGVLAGSKYYDEEGEEKEVRRIILDKAAEAKVQADKEKEEKKKARLEKKKREKEEREKKKKKA